MASSKFQNRMNPWVRNFMAEELRDVSILFETPTYHHPINHQPTTYQPADLPTYKFRIPPNYLPTYLPTYYHQPISQPTNQPTNQPPRCE